VEPPVGVEPTTYALRGLSGRVAEPSSCRLTCDNVSRCLSSQGIVLRPRVPILWPDHGQHRAGLESALAAQRPVDDALDELVQNQRRAALLSGLVGASHAYGEPELAS
jgi:hypothetical protein